jgi:ElaB/YqjD/DUF883 family membrane-anchored ribosome-binding protein
MSSDRAVSERGSAAASRNAARKGDEAAFLELQADAAWEALEATLAEMKANLTTACNPAAWAREHPWAAVGAAACAGLAAAIGGLRIAREPRKAWRWARRARRRAGAVFPGGRRRSRRAARSGGSLLGRMAIMTGGLLLKAAARAVASKVREEAAVYARRSPETAGRETE